MWFIQKAIILLLAFYIQISADNDFPIDINGHVISGNTSKWSYNDKKTGSLKWPQMHKNCGGSQQSPIDIDTEDTLKSAFLKPFKFHGYEKPLTDAVIMNDGNTVLLKTEKNRNPPFIKGGGLSGKHVFQQLHFHWGSSDNRGSEHRIDGRTYPAELHIIHERNKKLAIVAVFLEISKLDNPDLGPIFSSLSEVSEPGPAVPLREPFPLTNLLPSDATHYYRYMGSLTTPPCTESAVWTVLVKPVQIGENQLEALRHLRASSGSEHFLLDNFRPPQELHQRIVLESIANKSRETNTDRDFMQN